MKKVKIGIAAMLLVLLGAGLSGCPSKVKSLMDQFLEILGWYCVNVDPNYNLCASLRPPGGCVGGVCGSECIEGACVGNSAAPDATGQCVHQGFEIIDGYSQQVCRPCGPVMCAESSSSCVQLGSLNNVTSDTGLSVESVTPNPTNTILEKSGSITIVLNRSVDASSVTLSGGLGSEASGTIFFSRTSKFNDTMTVRPSTAWTEGSGRGLQVNLKDIDDNPGSFTIAYQVGLPEIPPDVNPPPEIPPWVLCLINPAMCGF